MVIIIARVGTSLKLVPPLLWRISGQKSTQQAKGIGLFGYVWFSNLHPEKYCKRQKNIVVGSWDLFFQSYNNNFPKGSPPKALGVLVS